jgi:hypothetical protein
MADEFDSEEEERPPKPRRKRVRWRKNGKLPGGKVRVEVQALGPKGAAAYAAQKERARKKRADTSTDEPTNTEPRE